MEFWVNLVKIESAKTDRAKKSLHSNCCHVTGSYFFMEGDVECLADDGIQYEVISEGPVDSLGDLTEEEKVKLVKYNFGKELEFSPLPEEFI